MEFAFHKKLWWYVVSAFRGTTADYVHAVVWFTIGAAALITVTIISSRMATLNYFDLRVLPIATSVSSDLQRVLTYLTCPPKVDPGLMRV